VNRKRSSRNYREIFKVAIPVSLEAVFQASFSLIDQIIVGSLGATAVAAVGLCNNLAFILTLLYAAIGTGSGAFIAQAYGRRDFEAISKIASLGQSTSAVLGICTALPLALFPAPILHGLGAREEVVNAGSVYLQLFLASAPMTVMSSVTSATFRAMSDSRTPMTVTMSAVALNTILALTLVFGLAGMPRLGVVGAGVATLISQTVRCVVLVLLLYRRKTGIRWRLPLSSASERLGLSLFQVTYPIALSELLWGTSTFVYIIFFTHISTDALAASQIVTVIESIFIVAGTGLPPAAVATAGQALGSDSKRKAKAQAKRVLWAGAIAGLAFTAALVCASFLLPIFYPRVEPNARQLAFWGIIITAIVQPAKVLNAIIGTGILPSGGDTKFVLVSHVASSYALGLPIATVATFVLRLGSWTVFASRALEELVKSVILIWRYRSGAWERKLKT
jgi:putative MATE family efflux protein